LSALQKWILTTAFKKLSGDGIDVKSLLKDNQDREHLGLDRLYVAEIKAGYYKLPARAWVKSRWKNVGTFLAAESCGTHLFEMADAPKYRAISAAISRAITRLEKRELVSVLQGTYSHWTAVTLTGVGKELAEKEILGAMASSPTTISATVHFKRR